MKTEGSVRSKCALDVVVCMWYHYARNESGGDSGSGAAARAGITDITPLPEMLGIASGYLSFGAVPSALYPPRFALHAVLMTFLLCPCRALSRFTFSQSCAS